MPQQVVLLRFLLIFYPNFSEFCAGANQRSRMLFQVSGPAMPSALSPFFLW